jgi:hypothetical protein
MSITSQARAAQAMTLTATTAIPATLMRDLAPGVAPPAAATWFVPSGWCAIEALIEP